MDMITFIFCMWLMLIAGVYFYGFFIGKDKERKEELIYLMSRYRDKLKDLDNSIASTVSMHEAHIRRMKLDKVRCEFRYSLYKEEFEKYGVKYE